MSVGGKLASAPAAGLCTTALASVAPATEGPPWPQDLFFQQIDRRPGGVLAIDNHTHLLYGWATP